MGEGRRHPLDEDAAILLSQMVDSQPLVTTERAQAERHRAAALAAAVRDLAADLGVRLDPGLRLWTLAGEGVAPARGRAPAGGATGSPPAGAEIAAAMG